MNNKVLLFGILSLIVIGGSLFFLSGNSNTNKDSLSNNLYPEQTITHGHGLAVDIVDPSKLYIATHHGLLVLINDTDLYRIGNNKDDYMGFSAHPTDANVFFSSGHPARGGNLGFLKSMDGGVRWQKVSGGIGGPVDFHAMAISPVNPNIIYGWYQGNLQRSIDQGETWEIVNKEIVPIYLVADTQDEKAVYAATLQGQGILVSRDNGTTWGALSPELEGGAVSVVAIHPQDARILLTFSEKLQGFGKSINAGETWHRIDERFNGETILHIAFSRINPNTVYVLTNENKIYKSNNAGDTWIHVR